jgi:hypothetical protein
MPQSWRTTVKVTIVENYPVEYLDDNLFSLPNAYLQRAKRLVHSPIID